MTRIDLAARRAVRRLGRGLRLAERRWRRSVSGVAAVEFAVILPVMVTMLLGLSEVTLAVNVDRKVTLISRALADLSSRAQTITQAQMGEIFSASAIIMQPFDGTKLKMVVTQMKVTKVGSVYNGSVDFSCARGPGAVVKPVAVYPVPTGYQNDNTYYMLIETALPYTPIFGKTLTGTINLGESTPWPIRNNTKVSLTGGCPSNP